MNYRDLSMNRTLVTEDDLKVFSQVRVISEYLAVFSTHSGITSLKFFRNLETIRGTILYQGTSALLVQANPGLRNLGFSSLHKIENGDIRFILNSKLCVSVDTDGLREAEVIKSSVAVVNVLNNLSCSTCIVIHAIM
ncbi:epidermal growth factor receptor-like [Corticium candelabrum]|uniref:epidermal growth factor receptor-like n=1 Tax=Corticium candelabrum TaxID=121492 RepID=UPI002E265ED5|nr:epidermal growth factor receptor-like [Corticium candelabrum]